MLFILVCCLGFLIPPTLGTSSDWTTLLSVDSTRGNLLTMQPWSSYTEAGFLFSKGSSLTIALPGQTTVSYNQQSATATWTLPLLAAAVATEQEAMYVTDSIGNLYIYNFAAAGTASWQLLSAGTSPIVQVTAYTNNLDLLIYYVNQQGCIVQFNPFLSALQSIYCGYYAGTTFLITDYQFTFTQAPRKLILGGFLKGQVTEIWDYGDNTWDNTIISLTGGDISKMVTYRNGASLWVVVAQGSTLVPDDGFLRVYDVTLGGQMIYSNNGGWWVGISDIAIYTDWNFQDWIVISLRDGHVYKMALANLDFSSEPILLAAPSVYTVVDGIVGLVCNWLASSSMPVIFAATTSGVISMLDESSSASWTVVANPNDWGSSTTTIDGMDVLSVTTSAQLVANNLAVSLSNGAVVLLTDQDYELLEAAPPLSSPIYQRKMLSSLDALNTTRPHQLHGTVATYLSFNQVRSLIIQDSSIYITLTSTSTTAVYNWVIIGFSYPSQSSREDQVSVLYYDASSTPANNIQSIRYELLFMYQDSQGNIYQWTSTQY